MQNAWIRTMLLVSSFAAGNLAAKNPEAIKRGANHPQYRHGQETLEAKAERSQRLGELRELEALSFALGLASGPKWRGRKPAGH
jgi:hypothetical protein